MVARDTARRRRGGLLHPDLSGGCECVETGLDLTRLRGDGHARSSGSRDAVHPLRHHGASSGRRCPGRRPGTTCAREIGTELLDLQLTEGFDRVGREGRRWRGARSGEPGDGRRPTEPAAVAFSFLKVSRVPGFPENHENHENHENPDNHENPENDENPENHENPENSMFSPCSPPEPTPVPAPVGQPGSRRGCAPRARRSTGRRRA